jgi:hypothetical protein
MTATIDYDLFVKNFIDALSATGHVTHSKYRKTHVTLHHNGGRLSHEGVLSVWQQRPASAHFNSDAAGTIAQYVVSNEYAWSTGSTEGNTRSISIEMCNQTLGPDWIVGEATWRSAARLAGWLFARIIGYRPTRDFLVVHGDWNPTLCAGPYIDRIYGDILAVAQYWYDVFTGAVTPQPEKPIQEDDSVYQVPGTINAEEPGWLNVMVPPVQASQPLPANGKSLAWVQIACPQYPLDIFGVYRVFSGGSELLWGPGYDPRLIVQQPDKPKIELAKPAVLLPDTYKVFKLKTQGTIGLAVLYQGPVALSGLVTLSVDGF